MQYIIQLPGHMHKFAYIVVVKLKLLKVKQVLNVPEIPCNQVIHANNMIPFLDEPITKMGAQKAGSSGN
jgi:hypothetical protein